MAIDYMKYICEMKQKEYGESCYKAIYPAYIQEDVMLPMKDGARLRTLIYKPASEKGIPVEGSLPVILERTCYPGQEPISRLHGEQLAKRGYIFISQYCRGTGGSEGEWEPNTNERADGLDTLRWLEEQEWVDVIGYWGNSYLALTGWAVADQVPDKVKGMCLTHYGTDRFKSAYEKGMFRQDVLTSWAMENAGYPVNADYMESCKFLPQIEVDEKLWGRKVQWYRDWITNTNREDSYWQQGWWKELYDIPSRVKVPLYIRSGWYDHHHGSSMNTWEKLAAKTKEHCWLDIGGWNHAFIPCMEDCKTEQLNSGDVQAMLEWFELVLKKKQRPEKRIRAYVIGADRWISLKEWPAGEGSSRKFYLEAGRNENVGSLEEQLASDKVKWTYQYDPADPVPSHGAESLLKSMMKNGSLVQPQPAYREDVVSFLSEPLEEDICIVGKMRVHLFVSSDCPDTAFTAKLMEERDNGKYYNIRSSITSICHDIGHPYEPGTTEQVTIEMWDITYQVRKGSRLRLDISSSDFPQYHIHSNYAGIWSMQTELQKAVQNIYCGKEYPSYIEIPYQRL
ncbi:MAG TPA: CocE/NonD family hydrolase [Clostridiales bacterium]|nr:CocE/NonD family hydrolase [Clostridiales bacterium]